MTDNEQPQPLTPLHQALNDLVERQHAEAERALDEDLALEALREGRYDPFEPDQQTIPDPREGGVELPPPALDPDQARRKRLSADLLELTIEDARRFEEREEQQRLDEIAENFERSLNDRED